MTRYIVRRLFALIPVMLVVGTVVFFLVHLIPGDPASIMAGPQATSEDVNRISHNLGLDQPLGVQYLKWFSNALRGDLGTSIFNQKPVLEVISSRVEPTIVLATLSSIVSVMIGVPLGVLAAARRGTLIDRLVMGLAVTGISVPYFWLGLTLVVLFAVELGWLPAVGYESIFSGNLGFFRYLVLPVAALGFSESGFIARLTRTTMVDVLSANYVQTATSKGLSRRRVLFRHALPNTLLLVITGVGLSFASLLGGAVITETIFNIRGIGLLVIEAIQRRDYPLIQGVVLFVAMINVFVNLLVDLLYILVDPRITYD